MLNQLPARGRYHHIAKAFSVPLLLLLIGLPAQAQFHAERAIVPEETVLEYGLSLIHI